MAEQAAEFQQWLGETRPKFEAVNEAADRIYEQNQAYDALVASDEEVTLAPLKEYVGDALRQEQAEAFQELLSRAAEAPYDELDAQQQRYAFVVGQTTVRLAELEAVRQERLARIEREQAAIAKRLPNHMAGLHDLILRLEAEARSPEQVALEKVRDEQARELTALDELTYQVAGKAWPLPRLISPRDELARLEAPAEATVEPTPGPEAVSVPLGVAPAERAAGLPDASERLAAALSATPGVPMTYEELGARLYGTDEDKQVVSVRIAGLLHALRAGKMNTLGRELAGRGLVLQQGTRLMYHRPSGVRIGRVRVVLRAIPIGNYRDVDPVNGGDDRVSWVDDEWRVVGVV